jgi:IS5 family transposase
LEDLFVASLQVGSAWMSPAGRPRLQLRLMLRLRYLKHALNLSDEELFER